VPNPSEVIYATLGGQTFRATRRTVAHLDWTIQRLAQKHPETSLRVIQPPYNIGVKASAGTHDKDAAFDVEILGLDWWAAQGFLRAHGWAAWVRLPPTFSWHIHMISLGYTGPVGVFIPGQVDDYYRRSFGLKGQHDTGLDNTWHPADISQTIFDYPAYLRDQEDNMPYNDWPKADKEALARDVGDVVFERLSTTRDKVARLMPALRRLGVKFGVEVDGPPPKKK
jgi:hypothetical protein